VRKKGKATTYGFLSLLDAGLDGCTTSIEISESINLILANYLDMLA
jgi:hypothetical protein